MDIKDLSKIQLLLLAVLLSFVTSIATGITTVTLMQQAPASFTAPVNRVIRQTVEKIQQVEGKTTVQTVVVKEEDLVVDAIAKNSSAVFFVTKEASDPNTGNTIEVDAGKGFAVSARNIVAVDGALVNSSGVYFLKNSSGKFKAEFIALDKSGVAFVKIGNPVDDKSKLAFTVPAFGDFSKMKAGQKILILGNPISSSIFDGADVNADGIKSNAGGLVLNLDGDALGIALFGENTHFASIQTITDALKPIDTQTP